MDASPLVPAIGLEVHAQLATRSKMFCACPTDFGAEPNTQICPVCLGMPGALPVVNERAVELALRLALAAGSVIRERSVFARKNYFYPDLPKGYQISQFESPLGEGGSLAVSDPAGERHVRLRRIHLEEDTGKSVHDARGGGTLVDMNRAGVPLLEIVTAPEIEGPAEARRALEGLKQLLEYLEVCDANMEEGNLRCDVNVSLGPPGGPLGTKTEIKNLNSLRAVERALAVEIARQRELRDGGRPVRPETLLWDERRQAVSPMRVKEETHDYRYFPEPDLPPLAVPAAWRERARAALPETPTARARRLRAAYGLPADDAHLLTSTRALADFFEETVRLGAEAPAAAHLVMRELLGALNLTGRRLAELPVTPAHVAELAALLKEGVVSGPLAREAFGRMLATGEMPRAIVEREGWIQLSDEAALSAVIRRVLAAHPDAARDYGRGEEKALQFLVGQVMKATSGKAHPGLVNELLRRALPRK